MILFDGHLDLAMNALEYERDQTLDVDALRARETPPGGDALADGRGTATVSLPELRAGRTAVVTATLLARAKPWVKPDRAPRRDNNDWPSQDMAHAVALGQMAYYELLEMRGELRVLHDRAALDEHLADWQPNGPVGVVLMLEGADPITEPEEVHAWHAWGLRCLSLAHFGHSHYAAGTPPRDPAAGEGDAPLTERGRDLLAEMATIPIALDLTHLSDTSFADAVDAFPGPVCATHANCRALADTPRQLTDDQLRRILERDGVVGMAIHNGMLAPENGDAPPRESVSLARVVDHIDHVCQLAGDARHVGLGSDLDGGYGREKTPRELDTHRDLHQLAPLLRARGYTDADVAAIFADNWLRFWRRVLPEG